MDGVPFYGINLRRAPARWRAMQRMYDEPGGLVRVDAFDGQQLAAYSNQVSLPPALPVHTPNEKAVACCTLSHIRAITQAYADGHPGGCIIEDDTQNVYAPWWEHGLRRVVHELAPPDAECITLFCGNGPFTSRMLEQGALFLPHAPHHFWGACCYYVTRAGMRKVRDAYVRGGRIVLPATMGGVFRGTPYAWAADLGAIYPLLRTYHYTRPMFVDECRTSFIHPEHTSTQGTQFDNHVRLLLYFARRAAAAGGPLVLPPPMCDDILYFAHEHARRRGGWPVDARDPGFPLRRVLEAHVAPALREMASKSENDPESAPPPLHIVAMDAGAGAGAGAGPRVPLDGPRRGAAEAAAPGGAGTEGAHYCVCLG